jgi:toxin HigB-1
MSLTLDVTRTYRYDHAVIRSFRCKKTEALFSGKCHRTFAPFRASAERKLLMLDSATTLQDLLIPPGNHLEVLHGERQGQHSIRINDRYRICFRWTAEGPKDVQIVDYH